MFGVFLKAKLDIETKINHLQRVYLDLLNAPLRGTIITENNNSDKAFEVIQEKINTLSSIKKEYEQVLTHHKELKKDLLNAYETSLNFENQIDNLFSFLELDIPDDLLRVVQVDSEHTTQSLGEDQESHEKSQLSLEEEEEEVSDKENTRNLCSFTDSGEYFSPNIQIRKSKSLKDPNDDCYTPAVKSHSKLPTLKRPF